MGIHDHYNTDAIDAKRIREELNKKESLKRQKQVAKDIADSGYSSGELCEVLTQITSNKDKDETKGPSDNKPLSGGQEDCSNNSSDIHLSIVGRIDLESINQRMHPEKKGKNIRLKKVATELNVGIQTIVQFLSKNGHQIEANPNTRISNQLYNLVLNTFDKERIVKEKSNKKVPIRTGENRVILTTESQEAENTNAINYKKEQAGDDGNNNAKPMGKNARKRAERRAMIATKRLKN